MLNSEESKSSSADETQTLSKSRFFRTRRKQRMNQNSTDEVNNNPIENTTKSRSRSPPLTPTIVITDESDADNNDDDDDEEDIPNSTFAQHRPSIHAYQRAKSHSVKLSRNKDDILLSPKKAVRFADDFGLNLSQMKVINTDELPFVPTEAFKHLQINASNNANSLASQERFKLVTYMEPVFENPLYTPGFTERVFQQKILLEQASKLIERTIMNICVYSTFSLDAIDNRIYGTIRLVSLGLHKQVKIRLTTDNWITYQDYAASYINNSYDGTCDRFTFTIDIDRDRLCTGNNIQFSISYESFVGSTYWDNNYERNYRFNCHSRTIPDYSL